MAKISSKNISKIQKYIQNILGYEIEQFNSNMKIITKRGNHIKNVDVEVVKLSMVITKQLKPKKKRKDIMKYSGEGEE